MKVNGGFAKDHLRLTVKRRWRDYTKRESVSMKPYACFPTHTACSVKDNPDTAMSACLRQIGATSTHKQWPA